MSTYSANHKSLPEYDIDPGQIPAIVAAARELPGVTDTIARNLGGWLATVHAGIGDGAATNTKARFRAILRELQGGAPPAGGDKPPRMYVSDAASPMSFDDLLVAA